MKNIIKNKIFVFLFGLFFLFILFFSFSDEKKKDLYEFAKVERGDVVQELNVTGTVKPKSNVNLAFEISGRVASVDVLVSDKVRKGDRLISLDSSEIDARFAQALAGVEAAKATLLQYEAAYLLEEAKLAELKKGVRVEDIQLSETKVLNAKKALTDLELELDSAKEKAKIDLSNLYDDVVDILNDSYIKADDALTRQIVNLFSEDSPNNFQITFAISDASLENEIEMERLKVKNELLVFKEELDNLEFSQTILDKALIKAEKHLIIIRDFLSDLDDSIDIATNLNSTVKSTYKGYITTGRNNINLEISEINIQKQKIATQRIVNQNNILKMETMVNNAENTLSIAEDELSLKKSGATKEQLDAQKQRVVQAEANIGQQQAIIKQSQANLNSLKSQILKTILYSPINGTIIRQDAKIGQIVTANIPLVSVISDGQFEIEVNISEADIAKVKVGNSAKLSFDAYGDNNIFEAEVVKIDPAETVIEGVSTYKTTLDFKNKNNKIRSGMTANIDILTGKKENVIKVPQRAVIEKDGEKFIRLMVNKKIKEVKVETGLRGSDGMIQIKRGLNIGDEIIVFEK